MPPIEPFEILLLQIYSKIQSVKSECSLLASKEYASATPLKLVHFFIELCSFLKDALDTLKAEYDRDPLDERNILHLSLLDLVVKSVGSDLRYIYGATVEKLPWSLVKPMQKFINELFPNEDLELLLRPQWRYNYGVNSENLIDEYKNAVANVALSLAMDEPENSFKDLPEDLRPISFPYMEKKNILLHSNLGHEIGHLVLHKILTKTQEANFVRKIRPEIDKVMANDIERIAKNVPNAFFKDVKNKNIASLIKQLGMMWKRCMEELLADTFGVYILGPAVLFSSFEIALQFNIDEMPASDNLYYPSWRTRLLNMTEDLVISGWIEGFRQMPDNRLADRVMAHLDKIQTYIKPDHRVDYENSSFPYRLVFNQIDKELPAFKNAMFSLGIEFPDHEELFDHLPILFDRLCNDIPPNAIETDDMNQIPRLPAILNACWLYKLLEIDNQVNLPSANYAKLQKLNRLGLKAVEYAYIHKEWRDEHERIVQS